MLSGLRSPLFLLSMMFINVNSEFWKKIEHPVSPSFVFQTWIYADSTIYCIVHCSYFNHSQIIGIQDGRCFCLIAEPSLITSFTMQVTLDSVFSRIVDASHCQSKGYDVYVEFGICIRYENSMTASWEDAQRICNKGGGQLLNIHSQELFHKVKELAKIHQQMLIKVGGFATSNGSNIEYHWSDGGEFDYKFWANREPNGQSHEFCIALLTLNGRTRGLADFPCKWTGPFYCQLLLQ